jgi:hypothetical protein
LPSEDGFRFDITEVRVLSIPTSESEKNATVEEVYLSFETFDNADFTPSSDIVVDKEFRETFNHHLWVLK